MSKGKKRLTPTQRRTRVYQIVFVAVSAIVLLSMILSLVLY